MIAGATVAVTIVVIGIAAGGYFYYTKYGCSAVSGEVVTPYSAPGSGEFSEVDSERTNSEIMDDLEHGASSNLDTKKGRQRTENL